MSTLAGRLVGRTEADIAREVRERLVTEGHDEAAFAIVAAGPHTASPHHEPTGREVRAGEPILLDIGGRLGGYHSDITRTAWVGGEARAAEPDGAFRAIHALVEEAQATGRGAVRPGVPLGDLDAAARSVIEAAGHGERFFHRLGHGIGLEVHEEPYLVAGRTDGVRVGDAFSIEPGVYLEGRFGVRIEDIVVCAEDGADVLNEAARSLLVVEGA
jgi:Xaa-Pro aminopeptidase